MAALTPPVCNFDCPAPDFTLPGTDGADHSLSSLKGERGLVVVFICNHCPFVIAILDRLIEDCRDLQSMGIGVGAICSNDAVNYPADSFDNMAKLAAQHRFPFPYLHDADQSVARAYGAVCTPDFFGFNAAGGLQFRGRLDAGRRDPMPEDRTRDLVDAMRMVAEIGQGPRDQIPSIGCSIKWALGTVA